MKKNKCKCKWKRDGKFIISDCGVCSSYSFEYKGYYNFYKYCPHCGRKLKII